MSIVNVELQNSTVWEQTLKVRMRVQNPNDRELPIKGLNYTLEVSGEKMADGQSAAAFVVPALGETEFDMNVRANMALTMLRVLGGNKSGKDALEYRLFGKVSLSSGILRSIPFEERGVLPLK